MTKLSEFNKPIAETTQPPPTIRHTAQELKSYFLDNAQPLVKQYIDAALGTGELKSFNADAREQVWSVLKQLMLNSSDKLDIDINSAQDVLTAVSKGKCTFEEGEKLLELYKKMSDIESNKMLPGSGSGAGFTINILGSTPVAAEPMKVIEHENES